ncbi:MAG: hypothetical protein RL213_1070 [Bacteroidota bacterium]|jgi:hypothetical protein
MAKKYKQCQSCGMPLKKDPLGGGSETDGSRSTMYCSSCYADGRFKDPGMTLSQMQGIVEKVLREEMKWPWLFRRLALKQLPRLERWKGK